MSRRSRLNSRLNGQQFQPQPQFQFGRPEQTWRAVGLPFYTCIQPVDCVVDQGYLAAIRSFYPAVVPIWSKQLWIAPDQKREAMTTHVGLAKYVQHPHRAKVMFRVEVPPDWTGPVPNELVVIWAKGDLATLQRGGPREFLPLDGERYRELQESFLSDTVDISELLDQRLRAAAETQKGAALKKELEAQYNRQQLAPLLARIDEHSTQADYEAYVAYVRGRNTRRVQFGPPRLPPQGFAVRPVQGRP